jgi:hypothetical protein
MKPPVKINDTDGQLELNSGTRFQREESEDASDVRAQRSVPLAFLDSAGDEAQ